MNEIQEDYYRELAENRYDIVSFMIDKVNGIAREAGGKLGDELRLVTSIAHNALVEENSQENKEQK